MKRYRVFGLVDSVIYLGPLAALLLALAFVPVPAQLAVGLAAAAWAFVASRYFWPRWKIRQSIAYYSHGFAVIPQAAPIERARVEATIGDALAFWERQPLGSGYHQLGKVGEGGTIAIYTTSNGIRDVRFPGMGPAHGLTEDNHIRLAFDPADPERVFRVLDHEVGHAVLHHVGYQGDHHARMAEAGRL